MNIRNKKIKFIPVLAVLIALMGMVSCEDFFNPDQDLIVDEDDYFTDWSEYRAAAMGLYALHQDLVEQIVILGELRADLLDVTENADNDLIEVNSFQISSGNKYASPTKFYTLIGACNRLATQIETFHPEVTDVDSDELSNYDRLYGEVLCMRAWAYFNAVRIYEEIPYIYPSLSTIDEINEYINSGSAYVDSVQIIYSPDGYSNDTIFNTDVTLDKQYYDLDMVIDHFTEELSSKIKDVGVDYSLDNDDDTWEVTIWNNSAMHTLLGQMYLFQGDYANAIEHFNQIIYYDNYNEDVETLLRYGLDETFAYSSWKSIFTSIEPYEHIYSLWFSQSEQQQNDLQYMFSSEAPNDYQLKPTQIAVKKWETTWKDKVVDLNTTNPDLTTLESPGTPGDYYRGYGVSYVFKKNGTIMTNAEVKEMREIKRLGYLNQVDEIMSGVDTIVYKYSIDKNSYSHDADFCIYRAASVHLYFAEIYMRWVTIHQEGDVYKTYATKGLNALNGGLFDGSYGVRGRAGLGAGTNAISGANVVYSYDDVTGEIVGYTDFTGNTEAKTLYLEDQVLEERARELAFEGERFYDLIRIAKRRNDPSYLADKVAAKFSGSEAVRIRELLMDESNWYIDLP